jgi:Na+-driven multidrug efflux pump
MLIQVFGLYVPLATLGSRILELRGVFGAALVANTVAGAVAFLWTRRVMAMRSREEVPPPGPGPDLGSGDPEGDPAEV